MQSLNTKALLASTVVVGSTILLGNTAQAATFTYDLTGSFSNSPTVTLSYPSGAPTLTLTAIKPNGNPGNVAVRSTGMGVQNDPGAGLIARNNIGSEELLLNFSQSVILKNATFARVTGNLDANDGFGLKDGSGNILVSLPTLNQVSLYNFSTPFIGSSFSFFAPQINDTYLLRSITVATVPESSSLVGLLGLGALGIMIQKRQKIKAISLHQKD